MRLASVLCVYVVRESQARDPLLIEKVRARQQKRETNRVRSRQQIRLTYTHVYERDAAVVLDVSFSRGWVGFRRSGRLVSVTTHYTCRTHILHCFCVAKEEKRWGVKEATGSLQP